MATTMIKTCDRCGNLIIEENEINYFNRNKYTVAIYGQSVMIPEKDYDLCKDCEQELIKWVNNDKTE